MWHPHMHMIMLCNEGSAPDQEALSRELYRATGDSHQVDVGEFAFSVENDYSAEALIRDLCEVCTYVLKLSSLDPADVVEAADYLNGKHLVKSWGNLRFGAEELQALENPFDEELDGPYMEYVFQWAGGYYQKKSENFFLNDVTSA
jgi:hypothetical protein